MTPAISRISHLSINPYLFISDFSCILLISLLFPPLFFVNILQLFLWSAVEHGFQMHPLAILQRQGTGPVHDQPGTVLIHAPRHQLQSGAPAGMCAAAASVPRGKFCSPDCDKCPKWGAKECLFSMHKRELNLCDTCPKYGADGCPFHGKDEPNPQPQPSCGPGPQPDNRRC